MADGAGTVGAADISSRVLRFSRYYDQTSRPAFSLALRITADAAQASAACEAAYLRAFITADEPSLLDFERQLLDGVRAEALRMRRDRVTEPLRSVVTESTYEQGNAFRTRLETLDPSARRAIELAYYGGIRVPEIAEVLGQSVASVRTAMRSALLELGASIQGGEGFRDERRRTGS